jgi:proteasome lid subunit RPN8/RPN11
MIRIESQAWETMRAHARQAYPEECCGALLGRLDAHQKLVTQAIPLANAFAGPHQTRYELRPEDLLEASREARREGLELVGIYHSHPDCGPCFSKTDLANSCPWYSFVVLSVRRGEVEQATSWLPNLDRTQAVEERLEHPCRGIDSMIQ